MKGISPRIAPAYLLVIVGVMLEVGFGTVGPGSVGIMYGPPLSVSNYLSGVKMAKWQRSVVVECMTVMLASSFCWKLLMVVNVGGSVLVERRSISFGWWGNKLRTLSDLFIFTR